MARAGLDFIGTGAAQAGCCFKFSSESRVYAGQLFCNIFKSKLKDAWHSHFFSQIHQQRVINRPSSKFVDSTKKLLNTNFVALLFLGVMLAPIQVASSPIDEIPIMDSVDFEPVAAFAATGEGFAPLLETNFLIICAGDDPLELSYGLVNARTNEVPIQGAYFASTIDEQGNPVATLFEERIVSNLNAGSAAQQVLEIDETDLTAFQIDAIFSEDDGSGKGISTRTYFVLACSVAEIIENLSDEFLGSLDLGETVEGLMNTIVVDPNQRIGTGCLRAAGVAIALTPRGNFGFEGSESNQCEVDEAWNENVLPVVQNTCNRTESWCNMLMNPCDGSASIACSSLGPSESPKPSQGDVEPAPETGHCRTASTDTGDMAQSAAGRWSVQMAQESLGAHAEVGEPNADGILMGVGQTRIDVPDRGEISQEVCYRAGGWDARESVIPDDPAQAQKEFDDCILAALLAAAVAGLSGNPMASVLAYTVVYVSCVLAYENKDFVGYISCQVTTPGTIWGGQDYENNWPRLEGAAYLVELSGTSGSSETKSNYYVPSNVDVDSGGYNGFHIFKYPETVTIYENEGYDNGKEACINALHDMRSLAWAAYLDYGNLEGDGDAEIAALIALKPISGVISDATKLGPDGDLYYSPTMGLMMSCDSVTDCPTELELSISQCGTVAVTSENPGEITYNFVGGVHSTEECLPKVQIKVNGQCEFGCGGEETLPGDVNDVSLPIVLKGEWTGGGDDSKASDPLGVSPIQVDRYGVEN
jgi:hypothetical protein